MPQVPDSPYQSYLLRFWEDGDGRRRIMLEQITPPQVRYYFNSLVELVRFLEDDLQRAGDEAGEDARR